MLKIRLMEESMMCYTQTAILFCSVADGDARRYIF